MLCDDLAETGELLLDMPLNFTNMIHCFCRDSWENGY